MKALDVVRLPLEIKRNGATYVFVKRGLKSLIYARTVPERDTTYEVFKIKIRKASIVKGVLLPANEIFPHNEAFGVWAWAPWSIERAIKRFESLESE